jgi:N-acetylmuramoyl-L-alanine amidase
MADERPELPAENDDELSASALFLEMMRQAAARRGETFPEDEAEAIEEEVVYYEPLPPDPKTIFETAMLAPEIEDIPEELPLEAPQEAPPFLPESLAEPELDSESLSVSDLPPALEEEPEEEAISESSVPETIIYQAPSPSEDARAAQLEEQRVRRIRRRKEQQIRRRVGIVGGFLRSSFVVVFAAALASTIFTWFTNPQFFTPRVISSLQVADSTSVVAVVPTTPTAIPVTPNWARRIGIVAGHHGPENDPGAVCPDGLTEVSITFSVAQLVVRNLREIGYSVDLLDEFDPRLDNYQAAALLSIHVNDCGDYNGEYVSGFLVARAAAKAAGGEDDVLAECVAREYFERMQIERRFSLTVDMTDYHSFREIHSLTPAAIIELGFLQDDRTMLTENQPDMANALVNGILCYLNGENPIATETPDALTPFPIAEVTEAAP